MPPKRPTKITFNYALSHAMAKRLDDYCEMTGRNESEVVRQLVLEFIEGDRRVDPAEIQAMTSTETRSSVQLRSTTDKAFEAKIEAEGLRSKSAVLGCLLDSFLNRSAKREERVHVSVPLPVSVVREATERAGASGATLFDYLSEVVCAAIKPPAPVSKET